MNFSLYSQLHGRTMVNAYSTLTSLTELLSLFKTCYTAVPNSLSGAFERMVNDGFRRFLRAQNWAALLVKENLMSFKET